MPAKSILASLRHVLLVVVLVFGLVGCRGGSGDGERRRVIASGPTLTTLPPPPERRLPPGGPLAPGSYRTTKFQVKLTFRVGPGWEVPTAETSGDFMLGRDVDATAPFEGQYLSFLRVEQVFATPLLTDRQLAGGRQRYLRAAPRDLAAWFRRHPYLTTSKPKPVQLGGVTGMQVDVTVKDLPARPDTCADANPRQCVFLFPFTNGDAFSSFEGGTTRYLVLRVGRAPLLVVIEAPKGRLRRFITEADKLLATVRFR
jgi:hypothetical protein